MKILTIMSVKSSINKVSSIRVLFFIFLIECWPIFKQDPKNRISATMLSEGLNNIIEKTQPSIFKIEKKLFYKIKY